MTSTDFWASTRERYYNAVDAGEHDDLCEVDVRGFFLCHCKKRARLAKGHIEPPGPLLYMAPSCPRCLRDVYHDGDGYVCEECHAFWNSNDESHEGEFTDDYEEELNEQRNRWLKRNNFPSDDDDEADKT
jgi:hypothetical protein